MRTVASRMFLGVLFVLLGVVLIGHVAGFWDAALLLRGWWALLLIVPGVASILRAGAHFWNVLLTLLGVWLFADAQGWLGGNSWLWFAGAALVAYGIWMMTGSIFSHRMDAEAQAAFSNGNFQVDEDDYPEYCCVFSAMNVVNRCKNFRGGRATGVFGRVSLDLREMEVRGHAVLEVAGVFGTVELLLPPGMPVKFTVVPVFGSYRNRRAPSMQGPAGEAFLEVRGASVFGSVLIL